MSEKLKVLILEDNQIDANLIIRVLDKSDLQCEFQVAQNRNAYLEALIQYSPHIILADYSLPQFDAIAAFELKNEKLPDIPFIIVSGTIGEERAVELIKSGVTDYGLKDKLLSLPNKISRAMKEVMAKKEKKKHEERINSQYTKLLEIAFLQSHQVRKPVANILGLISLFNTENINDPINLKVLAKLQNSAKELDKVILEIVETTNEIDRADLNIGLS